VNTQGGYHDALDPLVSAANAMCIVVTGLILDLDRTQSAIGKCDLAEALERR
jgi:hypothetical protein